MSELHLSILPEAQRLVWDVLTEHASHFHESDYYLAGGTALALQLGHRQSVDFDFFSQKASLADLTEAWLQPISGFHIRDIDRDTLHADIDSVKLSFIGAYKYPLIEEPLVFQGIRLAGVLDIALMKLLAISHRATPRDYIDLAAILQRGHSLADLLAACTRKYGPTFNTMIPLRALTSFGDLEEEMPVLLQENLAATWPDIIRQAVRSVGGGGAK